jgi:RimJ/RimL family protein N-acetyltransferase
MQKAMASKFELLTMLSSPRAFAFAIGTEYIDSTVKLIPINRLTESQWHAYHQLRLALRAYALSDQPPPRHGPDVFRARTLKTVTQLQGQEYVLFWGREDRAIGWLRFSGATGDLHVSFDFHHAELPEGFVRLIAKGLDHRFRNYHYPRGYCLVNQERHKVAMRQLMPSQEIILLDYELRPQDLNHERVAAIRTQFQADPQGFSLALTTNLPEEVWEDYIRLNTTFRRDLPLDGQLLETTPWTFDSLKRLAAVNLYNGQNFYVLFLVNAEGERVGLSEITVHSETGKCAQGMTGVLAPYRGRGLAQVLKAEMLHQLAGLVPNMTAITTHTAPTNLQMRHINEQLGFRHTVAMAQYTLMPEAIQAYLTKRQATTSL